MSLKRRPVKQLRGRLVDPVPMYPNQVPFRDSPLGAAIRRSGTVAGQSSGQGGGQHVSTGNILNRVLDGFGSKTVGSFSGSSYGALTVKLVALVIPSTNLKINRN